MLPVHGDVILDARGGARAMRLSWYAEGQLLVLSLWRGDTCSATFRLTRQQVVELIHSLTGGLARQHQRGSASCESRLGA